MKKILRWRYYCEFCKKSGGSAHHMKRHEESCTNNPDRHCRFCAIIGGYQEKMSVLIAALVESNSEEEGLKKLRDLTEGCPGCMLSAIRQSKMQYNKDGDVYYFDGFDFEKEKESFWKEYHQNNDYPYY